MPAIRFPASAVPLLPLCKGHGEHYVFRTYADMVVFLASFGFHRHSLEGVPLCERFAYVEAPNPIPFEVFENRGAVSSFVMIALAIDGNIAKAENESGLTLLIERLADLGATLLQKEKRPEASWPEMLCIKLQTDNSELDKI
jgi:hypothetical protein